jgi:hypothetical protein
MERRNPQYSKCPAREAQRPGHSGLRVVECQGRLNQLAQIQEPRPADFRAGAERGQRFAAHFTEAHTFGGKFPILSPSEFLVATTAAAAERNHAVLSAELLMRLAKRLRHWYAVNYREVYGLSISNEICSTMNPSGAAKHLSLAR